MSITIGETMTRSGSLKSNGTDTFKWSALQQRRLIEAYAELGTDWQLIQAIYFPRTCFCALKNKFYRIQHDIPPLAEVPLLSDVVPTDLVPVPQLRYDFPQRKSLIPSVAPL